MGKTLDALFGRNFKTFKLKTLANLAISRIAILKNQKQVRYSHARSDVIELLKIGRQESALLRVDHVIKDQNMIDVFVMIEGYCHLLIDSVMLLKNNNRECPDELKEAISSLIFAAPRCGEFPELQEIRGVFVSRFGKEFASHAVELGNNFGVNPKIVQKLSARQPSKESKLKVLKDIAAENGIILHLEEYDSVVFEDKLDFPQKQNLQESNKSTKYDNTKVRVPEGLKADEDFSESFKTRKTCTDVAIAAHEAFESAVYAATAARPAVELSRSESHDNIKED